MFTGIIEAQGLLAGIDTKGDGALVKIGVPSSFKLKERVQIGDSIACNGVCLTAVALYDDAFMADASPETMALTCFKHYRPGQKLNLELACTPATHLGGHIVQGHVDGIGEIVRTVKSSEAYDVYIRPPVELLKYIAPKGSIAVDGASLTVNELLDDNTFRLTLIPHTRDILDFSSWRPGTMVNIEADVLARYLEQLLKYGAGASKPVDEKQAGLSLESLSQNGFLKQF